MKLNPIYSSNMVFAHSRPIRIFGSGTGEAKITFNDVTKTVSSKEDKWEIQFSPMECGGPYSLTFSADGETMVFDDIYVGEVYLCAGQSNMQFKIKEGEDDSALFKSNNMLRLFSTKCFEDGDYFKPEDGWVKAEKNTVPEWSALAYFVGNLVQKNKNVAVGVVACYQGASVIESWVPQGLFEKNGIDIPLMEKGESHHSGEYSAWNHNGQLYEFSLCQVIPYSFSGVVWYQGESDSYGEESKIYDKELSLMIDTWRSDFKDKNLPFVIIQIADLDYRKDEGWLNIQKCQYEIQFKKTNVTTVTSADVCESDTIHPTKKYKLAEKVAEVLMKI